MADKMIDWQAAIMGGAKAAAWVGAGYAAAEVGGELLTASFDMIDDFASKGELEAGAVRFGAGTAVALAAGALMWKSNKDAAMVAVPLMIGGAAMSGGKEVAAPYLADAGDFVRELVGNPRGASTPSPVASAAQSANQMRMVRGGADNYGVIRGDLRTGRRGGGDLTRYGSTSRNQTPVPSSIGKTEIRINRSRR